MIGDPKVYDAVFEEVGNAPKPVKKIVTSIEVVTSDNRTYSGRKDYAKGDPWFEETRMSDSELIEKFKRFTKKSLSKQRADKIVQNVFQLDKMDDISDLMQLIQPS